MRYMTAADEDDLTSPSLIRKGIWLSKLLTNCIVNKNFDPDNLLVGDRNALLFWLRQSAYGTFYELSVKCPSCNEDFVNMFHLNQLIMNVLDIEPVSPGKNEFQFVLPTSKARVNFAFMTGKMATELDKEMEHQTNSKVPEEKVITSRLKKQIVSIEGETDVKLIEKFINQAMLAADALALRRFIDEHNPDVILKQNATCQKCGATNEFDIPIEIQFFWPQSRS
jgi:hypothetical protein